jgi:hypothetical protein
MQAAPLVAVAMGLAIEVVSAMGIPNAGCSSCAPLRRLAHGMEVVELIRLDTGPSYERLDPHVDYVVIFPSEPKIGPTVLEGGHNILIPRGHIVMEPGESELERRAIYIKNATGTVRIENVFIEGSDNAEFDAIAIFAPEAVVELINLRVEGVRGDFDGFHGDIVQPFGGVKKLRVDGLTGRSNYQGFYLQQTAGPIGSVSLRNVNLAYDVNPTNEVTFLLWLDGCDTYPVTLRNVYIEPRNGQLVGTHAVWPSEVQPRRCRAVQQGDEVTWPSVSEIDGMVIQGTPPAGDFVPAPDG